MPTTAAIRSITRFQMIFVTIDDIQVRGAFFLPAQDYVQVGKLPESLVVCIRAIQGVFVGAWAA